MKAASLIPDAAARSKPMLDIVWMPIPAGNCLDSQGKPHPVEAFEISCFPVTQRQFQYFVDDPAYGDPRWWEGLPTWARENAPQRKASDAPVTWVSWHEANAFCRWLGEKLGCTVRLPTELEWIRSARGDELWDYPWQGSYRHGSANLNEKAVSTGAACRGLVTSVGEYPGDISIFGVRDLVGNVHEWCVGSGSDSRHKQPYCGGAYLSSPKRARISVAGFAHPDLRSSTIGFRLVLEPCSKQPDGFMQHIVSPVDERIAEEAKELTGRLDLSELGLVRLPDALFGLKHLRHLSLRGNWDLADISRLNELPGLQSLDCSETKITDLSPLAELAGLKSLDCYETQVADLSPLAGLTALQSLNCLGSPVADLSPLSGLASLESLDCSKTQVHDLSPLADLSLLQSLSCIGCGVVNAPSDFWDKPSLEEVYLFGADIPSVPLEVLSQDLFDNCLPRLRDYFRDARINAETVRDIKLIVLGNGRVGKTQICRRLCGKDFQEHGSDSTHGIVVASTNRQKAALEFGKWKLWDFGGQDIYHGTHALFLRTRAVFLLVWSPEFENPGEHEHQGMMFRNYPLSYWLEYVRNLAGEDSPLIVVQTRCDTINDEQIDLVSADRASLRNFSFKKTLCYSAKNDRGRALLNETLDEAAQWLQDKEGLKHIPADWLAVQRRLEEWQALDRKAVTAERRRILSRMEFDGLCQETASDLAAETLLEYLHNAGIVFYRQNLFGGALVLNQEWALQAIYAIFDRSDVAYKNISAGNGRFTRFDLDASAWRNYGREEQEMFLAMMLECGTCFIYNRGKLAEGIEHKYIAPDLLPDRQTIADDLENLWHLDDADITVKTFHNKFTYRWLHLGLWRDFVAIIGERAGINAVYWKTGICFYESGTKSRALIEQELTNNWHGVIRISTRRGQAKELLDTVSACLRQAQARWAMKGLESAPHSSALNKPIESLAITQEPSMKKEICVSYAWGDDTPEGKAREDIIERFCEAARSRGISIVRDKDELKFGDSLTAFMQRIGQGNRVLVVLSDKYLRSPNCMYELYEIWKNSAHDKEKFKQRASVYPLPCANIYKLQGRIGYAAYWEEEYRILDNLLREHGPGTLGDQGFQEFKRIREFSSHVGYILDFFKYTLHPGNFEDLEKYELED